MFDSVSNQTRNEVWQGYLDAERLNRYYYRLANKYNKIYYTVKIMIAFAAVGGLTRLFGILPDKWISVADVATVIVLVLVILDLVQDYGKKLAVLNRVSKDSQLQLQEWKLLWNLVDKPGSKDEDVLKQMNILNKNAAASGAEVSNAGLGENKKFNQTAWEEANEVLSAHYAIRD